MTHKGVPELLSVRVPAFCATIDPLFPSSPYLNTPPFSHVPVAASWLPARGHSAVPGRGFYQGHRLPIGSYQQGGLLVHGPRLCCGEGEALSQKKCHHSTNLH